MEIEERFWSKVRRTDDGDDGCWEWTGSKDQHGYGTFSMAIPKGRRPVKAHRVALMLTGVAVDGLHACHTCDNPPCVRPSHLFLGTHKENLGDTARKGRGHRGYKLSDADVVDIRAALARGELQKDIAARYGVNRPCITKINCGERHGRVV